jgi:hypothetical protein
MKRTSALVLGLSLSLASMGAFAAEHSTSTSKAAPIAMAKKTKKPKKGSSPKPASPPAQGSTRG